jgi:hypothetical protein
MNKNLAILFGVFFVLLMVGMIYAAENESTPKGVYGQCVSQNALVKNTCFNATKQTLATCKSLVPNDDGKKEALKQCRATYKAEKKQCKVSFKTAKDTCKKTRDTTETTE